MACKKEAAMAGPDLTLVFTKDPSPINDVLEHLDKSGKTQCNMVSHKLDRTGICKVMGISPDETTCLPLPTSALAQKSCPWRMLRGTLRLTW